MKYVLSSVLILLPALSYAGNRSSLNMLGVSGLMTIPDAYALQHGKLLFNYNNFLYPDYLSNPTLEAQNFNVGIGVYPGLEMVGRLAETHRNGHDPHKYRDFKNRDLQGNIKWQLPIADGYPQFALGITDIGGLAVKARRYYAVSSYRWHSLDFTLGYAKAGGQGLQDFLSGPFAGVNYSLKEYLSLQLENDGVASRAGVQLNWLNILGSSLSASVKSSFYSTYAAEGNHVAFELSLPLGGEKVQSDKQINAKEVAKSRPFSVTEELKQSLPSTTLWPVDQSSGQDAVQLSSNVESLHDKSRVMGKTVYKSFNAEQKVQDEVQLNNLQSKLLSLGLEYVRIGYSSDKGLVVTYQNMGYGQSTLDAMADVILTLSKSSLILDFSYIQLVLLKEKIPVLQTKIDTTWLFNYFDGKLRRLPTKSEFKTQFAKLDMSDIAWQTLAKKKNWLDIEFSPTYKAYYGTEVGIWDYDLALNTKLKFSPWKGAQIFASYDTPMTHTYQYEDKKGRYFSDERSQAKWKELMVQQSFHLLPSVFNTTSYGQLYVLDRPYSGVFNTLSVYALNGRVQGYWKFGKLYGLPDSKFNNYVWSDRPFGVMGGQFFWPENNLSLEYERGTYYGQDLSQKVTISSYLGDAIFSVRYTQGEQWKDIAALVTLPLNTRKKAVLGPVSMGGSLAWTTGIKTVIANPIKSKANLVGQNPVGILPDTSITQSKDMMENNRLMPAYIDTHILQLLKRAGNLSD